MKSEKDHVNQGDIKHRNATVGADGLHSARLEPTRHANPNAAFDR